MKKMMAIPIYDRKNKIYNVYVNDNGIALPIGVMDGTRERLFEYGSAEEAIEWILENDKVLILAKTRKELMNGIAMEEAAITTIDSDKISEDAENLKKAIQG